MRPYKTQLLDRSAGGRAIKTPLEMPVRTTRFLKEESMKPFFMLYRECGAAPTVRHDTYHSAQVEAERLARLMPGVRFYILLSFAEVVKSEMQWSEFDLTQILPPQIPF